LFHFKILKIAIKAVVNQANKKNNAKYSINSEIDELIESWNESKTEAGK